MALPVYYPFKSRVLNTTVSSNTVSAVAVPARSKLLSVYYAFSATQSPAGVVDITVNGSTAGASGQNLGGISVTTSTANSSQTFYNIASNAATVNSSGGIIFLNSGDVLGTSGSTLAAGTVTFVVQEF